MKSGPDGDGVPGVADLLPLPVATTLAAKAAGKDGEEEQKEETRNSACH